MGVSSQEDQKSGRFNNFLMRICFFKNLSFFLSKNKFFYVSIVFVLILAILISGFFFGQNYFESKENTDENVSEKDNIGNKSLINESSFVPKPIYYPNPINGVLIDETTYNSLKNRPFLAVIIQNHKLSRPQYGLNEADIVYETLVESNITRFMAVYWQGSSDKVMSIRSARKYFVDLLGDYNNPAFMHIGYAYCVPTEKCDPKNDALVAMNGYGIRRLSDAVNSITKELSFSRDKNCERVKPIEHCAYTSTKRLWDIAEKKKWTNDLTKYTTWKFVDNIELEDEGKDLIDFTVNFTNYGNNYDPDYSVRWVYDPINKTYLRFNYDLTPFLDGNGKQVIAKTLIYQKIVSVPSGDYKNHQYQEVIGSGTGYVMQQGKVFPIKWKKESFSQKTKYVNPVTGKDFEFQRGKLWVMLVPNQTEFINNKPQEKVEN